MLWDILYVVFGLIGGFVIGFFVARFVFKRTLQKNPPINEEMIKTLMRGMGRNPSQKQVNQLMKQMSRFN